MEGNTKIDAYSQEVISKAISSYVPLKDYKKDSYVDAYDGFMWRVGIISKIEKETFGIHYEGWSVRCNDSFNINSIKIAPFRKMTTGYTGQIVRPFREFFYKKDVKEEIEAKMKDILEKNFEIKDPVIFTQFVRGDLFFFLDSLLSMLDLCTPSDDAIKEILEFIKFSLGFIVSWMSVFADLIREYQAGRKWEILHLIHSRTSVAMCYPEFIEILKGCFGITKRCINSFKVKSFKC